jgi:hypothetical protein
MFITVQWLDKKEMAAAKPVGRYGLPVFALGLLYLSGLVG